MHKILTLVQLNSNSLLVEILQVNLTFVHQVDKRSYFVRTVEISSQPRLRGLRLFCNDNV